MIISPDILERQLRAAKTENRVQLVHIVALDQLAKMIGMDKIKNPYESGELSYDKDLIILLFNRIHLNIPMYCRIATSRLLDYYCPIWRQFADPSVTGILINRSDSTVNSWRKSVLKRDNNKCCNCDGKDNLQAHHLLHWATNPEVRIDVDNGITLCGKCHSEMHQGLGIGMFIKPKKK